MKRLSLVFCLLITLTANFFYSLNAQVNKNDSLALVDLYSKTDGTHWALHTHWLTSAPVSKWYRVTMTGKRVTGINLVYNNLNGIIPASE